jgi:hypothetical protein
LQIGTVERGERPVALDDSIEAGERMMGRRHDNSSGATHPARDRAPSTVVGVSHRA